MTKKEEVLPRFQVTMPSLTAFFNTGYTMNNSPSSLSKKLEKLLTSPLAMREILQKLGVEPHQRSAFRRKIRDLADKGVIVKIRGSRYGLPDRMNLVTGVVQGHPDRFGFLIPDDPDESDVFLGAKNFDMVMSGDRVVVRVEATRSDGKREGTAIRVLERGIESAPGEFTRFRDGGFVTLFDQRVVHDIHIPRDGIFGAKTGQAVMVKLTDYPARKSQAVGKIEKILGNPEDPKVEIAIIVEKYKLRTNFAPTVIKEARKFSAPTAKELKGRLDLRDRDIVTIDGETAKDFDDAVEVERLKNDHFRLGVHIADASSYIREGSQLDREAQKRGNSVYFPGSVIPMLPFELSNDICSLNPDVDRLTLSCIMTFDPTGNLVRHQIKNTVIRSVERMTYTDVAAILEGNDPKLTKRYDRLVKKFHDMKELAGKLTKKRFEAGAIDFDLPEPEIILDVTGKPEAIILSQRNIAHRIIEEFMLVANRTVAAHLLKAKYRGLFRVHEDPNQKKINALKEFLDAFGYRFAPSKKITSKTMQQILKDFEGRPEEKLVTHVILRSMMQARYSPENSGHFGLAFERYAHFTSPIRRYPDLVVHRLLKELLAGKRRESHWDKTLPDLAVNCSKTERNAEDAEREVVKLRQTQYMKNHIGDKFEGVISGVTAFGFFVQLKEPPVEGLVRLTSMVDDYYVYSETAHSLHGERTSKRYRLGDSVKIIVEDASVERRRVEFVLDEKMKPDARGRGKRGAPKKKKSARKDSRRAKPKKTGTKKVAKKRARKKQR